MNLYLFDFGLATASQAQAKRLAQKPKAKAAPKVAAKKTKKGKGGSQLIFLKLTNFLLTKPHIFRCGNGKERGG